MAAEPRMTQSDEAPEVEPWPGVTRKALAWGDQMLVAEVRLTRGAFVPTHAHEHEQIGYVVSGKLEFLVDGTTLIVGPGDGYVIPSHAVHKVEIVEDTVVVDVFSPAHEDFKW